jgi:hypothetical protein
MPHRFPEALVEPGIPQVAAQDSRNLATPIPPGALLEAFGHWNQKLDLIIRKAPDL